MSIFDGKYNNDLTGAAAIEPGILLKIILYCYSLGIISSRKIAKMSKENMAVKAFAEVYALGFYLVACRRTKC
jgi:transposase